MISCFFLLGLSAFLLAHICYILCFVIIKKAERIKNSVLIITAAFLYGSTILWFLSPYLGEMKWPVFIYGATITLMLVTALHLIFQKNKSAGYLTGYGATLFVISDSALAFNKFYRSFEPAGIIVMLTYGIAQLLIIKGAIQYIRRE